MKKLLFIIGILFMTISVANATPANFVANNVTANTITLNGQDLNTKINDIAGLTGAMIYKGLKDCSTNPNYPAGTTGDEYVVSAAGKIGGASGTDVGIGDWIICITDNAGGNEATVGADWSIIPTHLVGNVAGPGSSTDGQVVQFDGATGQLLKALTLTGILKYTSGVPSVASAGTDYVVPAGNVATATALATTRAINGQNFDGTAPITVPVNNTDDHTTDSNMYLVWTATQGGNYAAHTSSNLTYHPSTGILSAAGFAGPLTGAVTGNVTGNVSGSSGSCTGNAATVTNGVVTSESYSNPSWITGLAWSKISTTPTTLSGYGITDAVPSNTTVNGHALSSNVTVTASDVSLGNVTNNAQVKKAASSTNGVVPKWSGTAGDAIVDGFTVGTSANNLVQLDGTGKLPAVDGSNLTNLPTGGTSTLPSGGTVGDLLFNSAPGEGAWGHVPTWNQDTTGTAAHGTTWGQYGVISGLSTSRTKTFRDAADTVLELGGSYTPSGTWNWGTATVTWPTFNQSTSGSAASLKSTATTGLMNITGPAAGSTRTKTVRNASDTILELGGSYTPTGAWNFTSLSGTWPTFNQNTTGSSASCTGNAATATKLATVSTLPTSGNYLPDEAPLSALNANTGGISQYNLVYVTSASTIAKAVCSGTKTRCIGIATAAASAGNPVTVMKRGLITNSSWTWTAGSDLYVDTTAGAITATPSSTSGNWTQYIGTALTATCIYVNPGPVVQND